MKNYIKNNRSVIVYILILYTAMIANTILLFIFNNLMAFIALILLETFISVKFFLKLVEEYNAINKAKILQEKLTKNRHKRVLLHFKVEDLKKEVDKLNVTIEENGNISLDDIYKLHQVYLLIMKYNILQYEIHLNPEPYADVYVKMSTYNKITINKDIIKNVNYHIEGTNVIL